MERAIVLERKGATRMGWKAVEIRGGRCRVAGA